MYLNVNFNVLDDKYRYVTFFVILVTRPGVL
jgi:hypothetical protein